MEDTYEEAGGRVAVNQASVTDNTCSNFLVLISHINDSSTYGLTYGVVTANRDEVHPI